MARQTLISFVGLRDPFASDPHEDGRYKGPVLTILDDRNFDRVILLVRPLRADQAERTRQALRELHPKINVQVIEIELIDSTNHSEIVMRLRAVLAGIHREALDEEWSVSLISGPPEIHACWVLLAVAGELTAKLINFRRTTHNGIAGPRFLRELDWSEPLAALSSETLSLLSARRDRWDDADHQGAAHTTPRHYFSRATLELAVNLSRHYAPLLVKGEPGTQKHLFAALVHQFSNRASGPFVIFNCATAPVEIMDSLLFGEEGTDEEGKLRQTDGGTLVMLKAQQLPSALILRLLKAVDDGQYYRPKGVVAVKVNVKLIFTTERDFEEEVRLGNLTAEIWRRLRTALITLPPLRERPRDIALLAKDELDRLNRTLPRPKRFSSAALAKLESHRWPSNVSELRRVVEHSVHTSEQSAIQPDDLDFELAVNLANVFTAAVPRLREGFSIVDYLRAVKVELVRGALRKTGGNQSKAALLLGLTPQAVSQILRQTGGRE
jgi:DNA-binding NtrC family response regulator